MKKIIVTIVLAVSMIVPVILGSLPMAPASTAVIPCVSTHMHPNKCIIVR